MALESAINIVNSSGIYLLDISEQDYRIVRKLRFMLPYLDAVANSGVLSCIVRNVVPCLSSFHIASLPKYVILLTPR
jgi:hypothetical protein